MRFLSITILVISLAGCLPSNPVGPPAPPAEVPAALRFPESVPIDVSALGGGLAETPPALSLADNVVETIFVSGVNATRSQTAIDINVLGPLNAIGDIPVRHPVTHFVSSPILIKSTIDPHEIATTKLTIDFSDFNGNGCTGNTCPVDCTNPLAGCTVGSCPTAADPSTLKPVCFRVWVDGPEGPRRFVSGRFTALPVLESDGDGHTVFKSRGAAELAGRAITLAVFQANDEPLFPDRSVFATLSYDQSRPEILKALDTQTFGEQFDELKPDNLSKGTSRLQLIQRGPEATAVKTVSLSIVLQLFTNGDLAQAQNLSVSGRWKEGADFWSGSQETSKSADDVNLLGGNVSVPLGNFKGACAELTNGKIHAIVEPNGVAGEPTLPEDPAEFVSEIANCRENSATDFGDTDFFDFPFGIDVTQYPNASAFPLLPDFSTIANVPFPLEFSEGLETADDVFVDFPETPGF